MSVQGTILVVDDSHESLKLLTDILSTEGYQVRPADSGELALASVAASPPELILLDIRMPGMDGFEVMRRLKGRQESRDIPVIVISAATETEHRVEGLKQGAVDFVSKPFQPEELLARIQTHLELHRLRAGLERQAADLRLANEQLQNGIAERKQMEEELRAAKERLEERVAERTAKLSIFADLLQKELAQRRKAEEELALNEERFRSLVTGSLVGIFILRDGRIAYMNPEQKRLFGDLPENFPLRELPDVHPEDRAKFKEFCDSVLSEKSGSLDIDLRFYPSGGSPAGVDLRWVHCRATAIRSGAKKTYLVNMVDITRLKEMEHQVRIREKLASLGHVAAGIAHEIRSPLSGINIYLAALQQVHGDAESMEPEARDQAAEIALQIQSAAHRIESVIKKVMDFTRPSAPRKEVVDVGMAVENAIDFTAANLVKNGITLDRSRLVPLPKCSADLSMITQVVMNLISNALQAMDDTRGSKIIEISSSAEGERIVLSVSDSGPGVPLAIRDKIFDPFYTTRKDGYGIGLSFCRRVIEDHAGTLEVGGSRLGGAEFRIGIPLPGKGIPT